MNASGMGARKTKLSLIILSYSIYRILKETQKNFGD